jgi:REP element-mobilizing transposase RayT
MLCVLAELRPAGILLSPLGRLVADCWHAIPCHFPDVTLDEFIIMPNHVHGIIVNWAGTSGSCATSDPRDAGVAWRPVVRDVKAKEGFARPVGRSLPTIMRSFKAGATRLARERGLWSNRPLWQRGYYEHVIRRAENLAEIRKYIRHNPERWREKKGLSDAAAR